MKCSSCGCECQENVTVCPECGESLVSAPATVTCCHCGKQIRPSAKYCVYCGGSQAQKPEEAAPAEVEAVCQVAEQIPAEETHTEKIPAEQIPVEAPAPEEEVPVAAPAPQIVYVPQAVKPAYQLPTGRGFWKMVLLGILTALVYPMVIMSRISVEVNMVASRHDGKRTMHFLWMPVVGVLTCGVYFFVWIHKLCGRIGAELRRRQVGYKFGAASFWLWNYLYGMIGAVITAVAGLILGQSIGLDEALTVLVACAGVLLSSIGPCIFLHKLMRASNLMNADYNENG